MFNHFLQRNHLGNVRMELKIWPYDVIKGQG